MRAARLLSCTCGSGRPRPSPYQVTPKTASRGLPRSAEGGQRRPTPPMKMSQIAAATLVPATVAGIVLTAVPFAQAAPASPPAHAAAAQHAAAAKPAKPAKAAKPGKSARPASAAATRHAPPQPAHHVDAVAQTPPQASTQPQPATVTQPLTSGMSAFEQCVAWHESGDNPTASSAGLFGILPATWAQLGYPGTAGQASVALQKVAFSRLYAQYGTSPWAP